MTLQEEEEGEEKEEEEKTAVKESLMEGAYLPLIMYGLFSIS